MRKLTYVALAGALAALAVPSVASADVPRCQDTVTTPATTAVVSKTATFTVLQPKDQVGQFDNVWKHVYTNVKVNPDNTFEGDGTVTDNDGTAVVWTEHITGKFNADNTVTFTTVPDAGATFAVTNAPMDGSTVKVDTTWTQNIVEFQIGAPSFKVETVTTGGETTTTAYKNHGEYVSISGGGKTAAQSCVGMPLNSKQGK